jgi:L-ascorbate metabolism protein UlaG (beta-lactamase superfamily)
MEIGQFEIASLIRLIFNRAFKIKSANMKAMGRTPSGKRLDRIRQSMNFKDGAFQNLSETKMLLEGVNYGKILMEYYKKPGDTQPPAPMPSVKTNLSALPDNKIVFVWFGHSSYLLRVNGFNILVDPVFSGHASPFTFFGKSFAGTDVYGVEEMPDIDLLVITHDHYDHMDFPTIMKLQPKLKSIVTSIGIGSHLDYWGIPDSKMTELDWWESLSIGPGWTLTATPARHFSGRTLVRNKTLWSSFVLNTGDHKIYLGGDSGYDGHFREIASKMGPFELAILECGQYGKNWPYIHMFPGETVKAAKDLQASLLIPVHWGKFVLSTHSWNEPIKRVVESATQQNMPIASPRIGEPFVLGEPFKQVRWWDF